MQDGISFKPPPPLVPDLRRVKILVTVPAHAQGKTYPPKAETRHLESHCIAMASTDLPHRPGKDILVPLSAFDARNVEYGRHHRNDDSFSHRRLCDHRLKARFSFEFVPSCTSGCKIRLRRLQTALRRNGSSTLDDQHEISTAPTSETASYLST